jgi:hypothetical protein
MNDDQGYIIEIDGAKFVVLWSVPSGNGYDGPPGYRIDGTRLKPLTGEEARKIAETAPSGDTMSSEAAALIEAEYAERLKTARNEADLDALWWSMVAEPAERMSEAVYRRFVTLDDDARTRLPAHPARRAPLLRLIVGTQQ